MRYSIAIYIYATSDFAQRLYVAQCGAMSVSLFLFLSRARSVRFPRAPKSLRLIIIVARVVIVMHEDLRLEASKARRLELGAKS